MTAIFDLEKLATALDNAEEHDDMDGAIVRRVYLGTVFELLPSGKYYMPYACSNVTEKEAMEDERWYEQAESELDQINAYMESGEGDPCDLFATRLVREADE